MVYAADLQKNPDNGCSLVGLYKALAEQGKERDGAAVKNLFGRAWADGNH